MSLLPVDEARARILKGVTPKSAEIVLLGAGLGRVLAQPLVAKRDQPPFDASAMDGYAVRSDDLAVLPYSLKVIGTAAAGHPFNGSLGDGEAVRIFTGASVPNGADAVVIQENVAAQNSRVTGSIAPSPGQNIRRKGLDFRRGETLILAGTLLNARDIGLAAAVNCATLRVRRKPIIAVLATGDELVRPGDKPRTGQIVSSNSHALLALATALGAQVIDGGIVRDNLRATEAAVRKLSRADILVTTGGASVGDHDFVQEALKRAGVKIDFWKIAMRPGKPFMYGRKGKQHVLGLPGNPVSALVCADLFLKPLVRALLGLTPLEPPLYATSGAELPANDARQDYLRGRLARGTDGRLTATPFSRQDSSMMRTFRDADCLIVRPPHAPESKKGEMIQILRLEH
jgi:molybdopterin molybdotransferase